jgi:uncharacterized protein
LREFKFQSAQAGAAITVKVTPRAKHDGITGVLADGTLKISLRAKPVEGAANEALIALLAHRLDVPKSRIDIIAGSHGDRKLISILGLSAEQVDTRLGLHERQGERKTGTHKKRKVSKR